MRVASLKVLILLGALFAQDARASDESVFGFWLIKNQRAVVEIVPCGEKACGYIVWLKEPLDRAGQPKTDAKNPDQDLRARTLCGIQLISDFKKTEAGAWSGGSLYSPRDGQAYSASMKLGGADTLKLRGYLLLPLLGQTQVWTREADNRGGC